MRLLALSAVLLTSGPVVAEQAPLRFSIADAWGMPLVQIEDHQPTSGLIFDIMQSMAAHANLSAEYRVVPIQRVQRTLERGAIDVRCYAAQSWMPSLSGDYTWSLPLLIQRDLLISTPDNATPRTPDNLTNETIGTVLGYAYPTLQTAFDNHTLRRDDARSEVQVLQKLQIHRYRYAVGNQWSLDWFNRNLPDDQKLRGVAVIDEQPVGCIVRNDSDIPAQRLMRILLRMRMSGEIDRIMSRYNTSSGLPVDGPAMP
ncbi:ABC transporter substrate-binding protein [Pseudomonas sp. SLFW]|uniref:substrate-binding periplasmic protein n=1 Tax=Pseudomonas sp. SLFW TaxID=2683259 RepID=UPI0014135D51|nr:transporter substrate-binding domain-containing protein [Pseudomonas sp. SLFW]NBB12760.1 transporter substrate-binding domain-containing protein [Pseudomonas sp. SLFW]